MKHLYIRHAILLTAFCLLTACAFAEAADSTNILETKTNTDKYEFCKENNYYSGKSRNISVKDLREFIVPAGGVLEVDGRKNGGVSVKGENRSDILIRACVRAWADSEEAATAAVNGTRIETSGVIRSAHNGNDSKHSVSYQILVPMQQDLKLSAKNGGISIKSVEGSLRFETVNGGISLKEVAGDVKGSTTNGGISVKLFGNSFNGNGLDVVTTNGGIKLMLPKNYAADVETGTVNGGFKSDFAALKVVRDEKRRWHRPKKVNASINGGGAKIRLVTTNGGVRIASTD